MINVVKYINPEVMGWGKPDLPAFSVRIQDALLVEDEMERRGFWMSSPHL